MQTFSDAVIQEWRRMMDDAITDKISPVLNGHAIQTFEHYKRLTGEISGLQRALEMMDEAQEQLSKRQ